MIRLHSVYIDDMNPNWRKEASATTHDMLILMTRGTSIYELDGTPAVLTKGDLLYIPRGTVRAGWNAPDGPHQKYSVHFTIIDSEHSNFGFAGKSLQTRARQFDYMKQRCMVLAQQWFGRLPHYETICQGIAIELLGHLAREMGEQKISSIKLRLMEEIQHYIRLHYREPIRIEQLAELVDRAPNYVTQTFKEVYGITPITYLHQLRIQAACDLILNTSMTMSDIAEHLGYSDQAYFNRMFRKMMGRPPTHIVQERRH